MDSKVKRNSISIISKSMSPLEVNETIEKINYTMLDNQNNNDMSAGDYTPKITANSNFGSPSSDFSLSPKELAKEKE
jgi:hypothetical protein